MTPRRIAEVEVRHVSPAVEAIVRRWFERRRLIGTWGLRHSADGRRSIRLPHPEQPGLELKIKGSGFLGKRIRFGQAYESGTASPLFDFDGRMMTDVASAHDNTWIGGASFQQVVIEYEMTRRLTELGIPVVPCLGYGRVREGREESWFSVFELDPTWRSVELPYADMDAFAEAMTQVGQLILDLAVSHRLIGYCWYVAGSDGELIVKDLHPFRRSDPVNMSQLSWVMQMIFALHVPCFSAIHAVDRFDLDAPEDLQALPFRAVLADAGKRDHDDLRFTVVAKHILTQPTSFSTGALLEVLEANRIGRALLENCPPEYARR